MYRVKSSIIGAIGYDTRTREALVTFIGRDGHATATYRYQNVPPIDVCTLMFAPSIGSTWQSTIKHAWVTYSREEVIVEPNDDGHPGISLFGPEVGA